MKNAWKWLLGIAIVLLIFVALPFGLGFFVPRYGFGYGCCGWSGYHGWGMMPFGHMGWGMMPFGFFGWIFPLLFLALIVLGIWWLINALSGSKSTTISCPSCGKPLESNWKACPYCGYSLSAGETVEKQ